MRAAHRAAAAAAAARHWAPPGLRSLRWWARTAACLVDRGWAVRSALRLGWEQAYVQDAASKDGADLLWDLFQQHFPDDSLPALAPSPPYDAHPSLVRPCAWPLASSLEAVIHDSHAAALRLNAALLEACLSQAAAAQVANLGNASASASRQLLRPPSWLPGEVLEAVFSANARPPNTGALTGDAAAVMLGNSGPGRPHAVATADYVGREMRDGGPGDTLQYIEGYLRLAWAAGALLGDRGASKQCGAGPAVALVQRMHRLLQDGREGLEALDAAVTAEQIQGLIALNLGEGEAAQVAWEAVKGGMLLASAVTEDAGQASLHSSSMGLLQLSAWRFRRPQLRAGTQPPHPAVDSLYPALSAVAALENAVVPLLSARHQPLPQSLLSRVRELQDWRGEMWHLVHGSVRPHALASATQAHPELCALAWSRVLRAAERIIAALPASHGLEEGVERVRHAGRQLADALGLPPEPPPKPLLWHAAGHPKPASSPALQALASQLARLTSRFSWDGGYGTAGLPKIQTAEDADADADGTAEAEAAESACVAADSGLRLSVLEGVCLFWLALSGDCGGTPGPDHSLVPSGSALDDSAAEIVNLLAAKVDECQEQVRRARGAVSSGAPGGPGLPDPQVTIDQVSNDGTLPLTLPWPLLLDPQARPIQATLLPFQVLRQIRKEAVQLQSLMDVLLKDCLPAPGTASALSKLGREGAAACVGNVADLAPYQLLAWLLEASPSPLEPEQEKKMAELVHGTWYTWHRRLWDTTLAAALLRYPRGTLSGGTPGTSGLRGTAGATPSNAFGGCAPEGDSWTPAAVLTDVPQTRLALPVVGAPSPSVADLPSRLLLLKLLAREMRTWPTRGGRQAGEAACLAERHGQRQLLAQLLGAHVPTLPDQATQDSMSEVVAALLGAPHGPPPASNGQHKSPHRLGEAMVWAASQSRHATFVEVAAPLLRPCLEACLAGDGGPEAASLRGRAWALLGAARLALVSPPRGTDPASKYAFKRNHLLRMVFSDLLPQLQVRQAAQLLPGGESEAQAIAALEARAASMEAAAAALAPRCVARPDPPQYSALLAAVYRFTGGLGSPARLAALVSGLEGEGEARTAARREAEAWQAAAAVWAAGLLRDFPHYLDIVQPLVLATLEARAGLSLLLGTARRPAHVLQRALSALMAFPLPFAGTGAGRGAARAVAGGAEEAASGHRVLEPVLALASPAGLAAIGKAAAAAAGLVSSSPGQSALQGVTDKNLQSASHIARLGALRVALHIAAREAVTQNSVGGAPENLALVIDALAATWEEAKAAEEAAAAERAAEFKTKEQSLHVQSEEEEAEAEYARIFRDHFADHFADLASTEEEGEVPMEEDREDEGGRGPAAAQVFAKEVLEGDLLNDVVLLHARSYRALAAAEARLPNQAAEAEESEAELRIVFERSYRLGASLLAGAGPTDYALSPDLDVTAAGGHLMMACQVHASLSRPPPSNVDAPHAAGGLDMQAPAPEELRLMQEPVQAMRGRLIAILEEHPGNAVLLAPLAVCDRLLGMPVGHTPLKAALTGLELLLARSQLWQETAPASLKLTEHLSRVTQLAARWRRAELASWRTLLAASARHHAAGAHRMFFHLRRLLLVPPEAGSGSGTASDGRIEEGGTAGIADVAIAIEQFLQTSTLGEFERRLNMVWSFRCQAAVDKSLRAEAGPLLANAHAFYSQYLPAVTTKLTDGLAPVEKLLLDFIKLAKWEDRGYYAQLKATEKAQRQLHKFVRSAAEVLNRPVAEVLGSGERASPFDSLRSSPFPASSKGEPRKDAPVQTKEGAKERWRAFCGLAVQQWKRNFGSTTALLEPHAPTGPADPSAASEVPETRNLRDRVAALTQRMPDVLEPCITSLCKPEDCAAAGTRAEEVAERAAETAVQLREQTDKAARARKKKALTDFLAALGDLGLSRMRTAVPPQQRSPHSWFLQEPPPHMLLPLREGEPDEARYPIDSGAGRPTWCKADSYYYRSIARLQTLLEAAKAPHKDISQAEVESAKNLGQHALYLLRQQRRHLACTAESLEGLRTAAAAMSDFASHIDAGMAMPSQESCRKALLQQQRLLPSL
eukprot:jgi/Botrbrau1/195/Bobra.0022s0175.1